MSRLDFWKGKDNKRQVNIWYVSALSLCNFDCKYCASGEADAGGRTKKSEWQYERAAKDYSRILDWISEQTYSIGIRLQTIGEPFVSPTFLQGTARLSNSPNIEFVELVSNASLLTSKLVILLKDYAAVKDKIKLWLTYHHTEISVEAFMKQVIFAKNKGVELIVNGLLFPDNLEILKQLVNRCREEGVQFNIDLGQNLNGAFDSPQFFPVMNPVLSDETIELLGLKESDYIIPVIADMSPKGFSCSAGFDYAYITPQGDIHTCKTLSTLGSADKIGSALDSDFKLDFRRKEYLPCKALSGCVCKEDYLHLGIAKSDCGEVKKSLGVGYIGTVSSKESNKKVTTYERLKRYM